ncbi:MAG: UDP-N-acetylmuramate dehydrogenase [Chloroflexota bacterium]
MPELADLLMLALGPDLVRTDEPLSRHTSFRIGGPADIFVTPKRAEDLSLALRLAREHGAPAFVFGNGTNMLVRDGGVRGVVIKVAGCCKEIAISGTRLRAGAGLLLSEVAAAASEAGLSGLEFAAGIPGTVGGAVVMNAGAYEGEMKDVVVRVETLDATGEPRLYTAAEIGFGYRQSILQQRSDIVTAVTFGLRFGDKDEINALIKDYGERRAARQPLDLPSAGSTFRRPPGHYAGDLIQRAGLRGYTVGGAQVSEKHAGFIVNRGGATARDVLAVIAHVQQEVERQFGVWLEPEVKVIGEDDPPAQRK